MQCLLCSKKWISGVYDAGEPALGELREVWATDGLLSQAAEPGFPG